MKFFMVHSTIELASRCVLGSENFKVGNLKFFVAEKLSGSDAEVLRTVSSKFHSTLWTELEKVQFDSEP